MERIVVKTLHCLQEMSFNETNNTVDDFNKSII